MRIIWSLMLFTWRTFQENPHACTHAFFLFVLLQNLVLFVCLYLSPSCVKNHNPHWIWKVVPFYHCISHNCINIWLDSNIQIKIFGWRQIMQLWSYDHKNTHTHSLDLKDQTLDPPPLISEVESKWQLVGDKTENLKWSKDQYFPATLGLFISLFPPQ